MKGLPTELANRGLPSSSPLASSPLKISGHVSETFKGGSTDERLRPGKRWSLTRGCGSVALRE